MFLNNNCYYYNKKTKILQKYLPYHIIKLGTNKKTKKQNLVWPVPVRALAKNNGFY